MKGSISKIMSRNVDKNLTTSGGSKRHESISHSVNRPLFMFKAIYPPPSPPLHFHIFPSLIHRCQFLSHKMML